MSAPLDPAQARDISFAALLRVVLHECAQAPLTLLTADTEPAVIRIARGGEQREQAFAEMLVEAYESASEMLLARITKLTCNRADADDIVQTAFMRVYARWPDHITDVEGLRKYLWTTAENLVKDAMVRAAKDRERLDSDGHERLSVLADHAGGGDPDQDLTLTGARHQRVGDRSHVLRTVEGRLLQRAHGRGNVHWRSAFLSCRPRPPQKESAAPEPHGVSFRRR